MAFLFIVFRNARVPRISRGGDSATFAYVMFKTLGDLMPKKYSIKRVHNNLDVNTPLFRCVEYGVIYI